MFYRQTDLPSRVGRLDIFIIIISGSKNDPKNTKILKKICHFLQKNFGKIFWLTFRNFQLKFLDFGQKKKKNGWFYKILQKLF